jgi:HPt (histidine-containing phosphotransfer) domain-containing protein
MSEARANPSHRSAVRCAGSSATGAAPGDVESPSAAGIIDVAHLRLMTFGEKALQAEVLALFKRQADMLLARMHEAPAQAGAAFAHTLAGSARGVGAWRIAAAAEAVELATRDEGAGAIAGALRRLEVAVHEARAAIGAMLAAD